MATEVVHGTIVGQIGLDAVEVRLTDDAADLKPGSVVEFHDATGIDPVGCRATVLATDNEAMVVLLLDRTSRTEQIVGRASDSMYQYSPTRNTKPGTELFG